MIHANKAHIINGITNKKRMTYPRFVFISILTAFFIFLNLLVYGSLVG